MRSLRRVVAAAVAAGTALAACTGVGTAASAASLPLRVDRTLPQSFVAPLQFAIGTRIYVADSAVSALYRLGSRSPIATGPAPSKNPESSGSVDGVDVARGLIGYTETQANHRNTYFTVLHHGTRVLRVNLGAYERAHNPDGIQHYGAVDPSKVTKACAAVLKKQGVPVAYTGLKDSHPYAVQALPGGSWLIADAGGNDVVEVDATGGISTFAVLPAQHPVDLGRLAKPCSGVEYRFEAVPTDVELGPDGVYVSALPGGDGLPGSVYRIGDDHQPTLVGTGIPQVTNLAVTPTGTVYVASLGTAVYRLTGGRPTKVADVAGVAAIEWANGRLYASTAPAVLGGKGSGHIVVLR